MDPFDAPSTTGGEASFGVASTVQRAVLAAARNVVPALGAALVGTVVYLLSICTLVGWIVALPLLGWGVYVFLLEADAGRASVSAIWSARERPGRALVQMWLYSGLYVLPLTVLNLAPTVGWNVMQTGQPFPVEPVEPLVTTLLSMGFGLLWGVVVCRFSLAPFLMVDRGDSALAALNGSWRVTGPVWGAMFSLLLVGMMVTWPGSLLMIGAQWASQRIDIGVFAESWRPAVVAAQIAGVLYSAMLSFVVQLLWASAYRQLIDGPDGSAAAGAH